MSHRELSPAFLMMWGVGAGKGQDGGGECIVTADSPGCKAIPSNIKFTNLKLKECNFGQYTLPFFNSSFLRFSRLL